MVEGTQVGGYRVLELIGVGGMGEVWMAEHEMLGRRAAIKILRPELSNRPEIVTRFFNEARAATSIADPGIVQIFDFGHHSDGSAYIVMELLDGEGLDRRLKRAGVLAISDALRIMRQVCGSLGAAHAAGIVHRDLKPENIFLVRDPEVPGGERAKILDFGIAKLVGDTQVKTQTSVMMGTPTFMSPEQCRGAGQVDQRADVYSLGCVLFMLITGRPPFDADGAGEIIAAHLREPPPALSSRLGGIPPDLDQLVLRCMAKDPARRFSSATALASAMGAVLGTPSQVDGARTISAYPTPVINTAQTTLTTASGMAGATLPMTRGRGWVVAGVVVSALGGVGAFLAMHRSNDASTPPAPAPPVPVAAPPVTLKPKPSPPDPRVAVAEPMIAALTSFVAWARSHAGAPCPDAATLAITTNDPWSHPFRITCTDQPGDQIIGAISAGPDGVPGTADDLASWQLGRDVTDLVRGARWVVAPPPPTVTVRTVKRPHPPTATPTPPLPPPPTKPPVKKEGVQLDENGMPISR